MIGLEKKFADKRIEAGISIRSLAKLIGVSAATLSRFERGIASPDKHTMERILGWYLHGRMGTPANRKISSVLNAIEMKIEDLDTRLSWVENFIPAGYK